MSEPHNGLPIYSFHLEFSLRVLPGKYMTMRLVSKRHAFHLAQVVPENVIESLYFFSMATGNSITKDTTSFFLWEGLLCIWGWKPSFLLIFIFACIVMHYDYWHDFVAYTWDGKAINASSLRKHMWLEVFVQRGRRDTKGRKKENNKLVTAKWNTYTYTNLHTYAHTHNKTDTIV